MYNEELEMLIDAALVDGELTEKEKQVLFKKAQAMGVDLDEFEMVLDARLVKLKQKQDKKTKTSVPKSNKYGDVKKCPACGAIVQSFQGSCPECGYVFEGVDANAAVKELASLLREAGKGRNEESSKVYNDRLANIINTFPIPMEKATLLSFMTWLLSQSYEIEGVMSETYKQKFEECILKAKIIFPNDETFVRLATEYKRKKWKQQKKTIIMVASAIGLYFLLMLFCAIMAYFEDK